MKKAQKIYLVTVIISILFLIIHQAIGVNFESGLLYGLFVGGFLLLSEGISFLIRKLSNRSLLAFIPSFLGFALGVILIILAYALPSCGAICSGNFIFLLIGLEIIWWSSLSLSITQLVETYYFERTPLPKVGPLNRKFFIRVLMYVLGMILTALGVNLTLQSNLGAGAWDCVNSNLSQLASITVGTASAMINAIIILFVILYNRNLKYLLMGIPAMGISYFIDLWNYNLFVYLGTLSIEIRILFVLLGLFVITWGLALIIVTKFPAMVFDELTFSLMRLFRTKSFTLIRWGIEFTAVALALLFGFAAGIGFGSLTVGTILISFIFGPLVAWQIRWTQKLIK